MLQAITFHQEIRNGSSLPLLISADDGNQYVLKPFGSGDGKMSSMVEWLTSQLGISLGLPILKPVLIRVDSNFMYQAKDPETIELLERSPGINFATPYLDSSQPYNPALNHYLSQHTKTYIYLFDLLVLNIDRTLSNPNMIFQNHHAWCLDYSSCFAIRNLIEGKASNEQTLLTYLRKHPFYHPEINTLTFILHLEALTHDFIKPMVNFIPDEWLNNISITREQIQQRLWELCHHKHNLDKRHSAIKTIIPESPEEEKQRTLKNRELFEQKYGKL